MSALTDVQQALNIVRQSADQAEWDMRLEMLQLTMATAADIVALSRKLTKPKQRTQTKTNLIPKTKVVKRYVDALAPKTAACQRRLNFDPPRRFKSDPPGLWEGRDTWSLHIAQADPGLVVQRG